MNSIENKDMFMDRTSKLLSRVLDFRSARQEVISGNLANIDTPGYRPKEISFEKALKRAVDGANAGLKRTDPSHLSGGEEIMNNTYDVRRMTRESGKKELNIDTEMARMTQNNLLYEASARLLSNRLQSLKSVIEGTGR